MKICPYCGSNLEDDMKWCFSCGKQQPELAAQQAIQEEPNMQMQQQMQVPPQTTYSQLGMPGQPGMFGQSGMYGQPGMYGMPNAPKKSKKGIIIGIIVALLAIIAIVVAIVLVVNKDDDDDDDDKKDKKSKISASTTYDGTMYAIIKALNDDDYDAFKKLCVETSDEDFIEDVYEELNSDEEIKKIEFVNENVVSEMYDDDDECDDILDEFKEMYEVEVTDAAALRVKVEIGEEESMWMVPMIKVNGKWYLCED